MEEKMERNIMKNKMLINKNYNANKFRAGTLSVILILLFSFIILMSSVVSAVTIKNVITSPSEVAPGETAKITIEIENTLSDDIQNVNVALDITGSVPIAPYQGSSEENIDEIREGDEEKFIFNIIVLPDASPGIYKIPVKISYEINGTKETKNSTIGLIINSPPQIRISIEGYLIKGQEGIVNVKIINNGLSDLKFVSAQATQPVSGATINSPLYEYIGNIESDDFESIEYKIFANENSLSTISIPIKIIYKDSTNKDFTKEEILSIKVYSNDEAKRLGLIPVGSYTLYVAIGIIILLYLIYRIRKRMKKRKAQGA